MIAALFDIEGTLYSQPMGRGFIEYARRDGRRLRALLYYALLMPKYGLNKLGILPEELLYRSAIARMPWLVQGYDLQQAARAFDWVAKSFILTSGVEPVLGAGNDIANSVTCCCSCPVDCHHAWSALVPTWVRRASLGQTWMRWMAALQGGWPRPSRLAARRPNALPCSCQY